jgi:nucleotide-binding universal stress UspA family protein
MFAEILVAIDLGEEDSWNEALAAADALARTFASRVSLCTILSDWAAAGEAEWSSIAYRERLEKARLRLLDLIPAGSEREVEVGCGPFGATLLEIADRREIDLIILPSHKPHFADLFLGFDTARIAVRARQSVLVVRSELRPGSERGSL